MLDFREEIENWCRALEMAEKSEKTVRNYQDKAEQWLKYCQERKMDPLTISQEDFEVYLHWRLVKRRQRGTTRYAHYIGVKLFYEHLLRKGLVESNPIAGVSPPKKERRSKGCLTNDDIEMMIAAPGMDAEKGMRDTALLCILAAVGNRVSSLTTLTTDNLKTDRIPVPPKCLHCGQVDFAGHSTLRKKTEQVLIITLKEKGKKEWSVPLHDKATFCLLQYLANREHGHESKIVFPSFHGRRDPVHVKAITRQGILSVVKEYAKVAGIRESVSPHSFRGAAITWALDCGIDPQTVQNFYGHSSLSTTSEYRGVTHRSFMWSGIAKQMNLLEAVNTPVDDLMERVK